jgi:hypothetical protein
VSDLVIHIGRVLDRVSNLFTQEPPITLAQIMQLFFHDRLCNAQGGGELGIRDIGVLCREMIAQSLKKPQTSFTFTLLSQTPERLLHYRHRPAKVEKSLGRKRVERAIRDRQLRGPQSSLRGRTS